MPNIVKTRSDRVRMDTEYCVGYRPDSAVNLADLYGSANILHSKSTGYVDSVRTSTRSLSPSDWKRRIARSENATSYVKFEHSVYSPGSGEFGMISKDSGITNWALVKGTPIYDINQYNHQGDIDNVTNTNNIGFLRRCREIQNRFSGGVFLGELRETIKMIASPGKAIVKALERHQKLMKQALRGRFHDVSYSEIYGPRKGTPTKRVRETAKFVSDSWLSFKFGISPLLSDLDSGMRATAEYFEYAPREYVSYKTTSRKASHGTRVDFAQGDLRYTMLTSSETFTKVTTRGAVKLDGPNQSNPSIQKHFGLSWQDAILTGWEIIPYSFVVDYFLNVGECLEAALFPQSLISWSNRTIDVNGSGVNTVLPDSVRQVWLGSAKTQIIYTGDPSLRYSRRSIERVSNPLLVPALRFRVPGAESTQWVNLGALLGGRLS
jgi:hypothetical protein